MIILSCKNYVCKFYKNVKLNEKENTFFYCRLMNPSDLEDIKGLKHHLLFLTQKTCDIPFVPLTLLNPDDSAIP
jgi:hypothetical protein